MYWTYLIAGISINELLKTAINASITGLTVFLTVRYSTRVTDHVEKLTRISKRKAVQKKRLGGDK